MPDAEPGIEIVSRPSVVEHVSWKTMVPPRTIVNSRGRPLKIAHPLMQQCAEMCTDATWERIFRRAAKGRLPSHFVLKEDRLSVKIRKKIVSVIVPTDPAEAMEVFQTFVNNYDNIYTSQEQNTPPDPNVLRNSLAKNLAHRRRFRKNMLNRFVQATGQAHNLSQQQISELAFTVHMGFQFNMLKSRDIVVDDEQREILSIKGLEFSELHGRFDLHRKVFTIPAFKRKIKPLPGSKPADVNVRDLLLSRITHRHTTKQAISTIPNPALEDDDCLNLSYVRMVCE